MQIRQFVCALLIIAFAPTEANATGNCDFNSLELSPDGRKALVWKDASVAINQSKRWSSTRQFAIVSHEGNAELRRTKPVITNLQWLFGSGSFIAFTDPGWTYEIDAETGMAKPIGVRNSALSSIHLTLQSYVTELALNKLLHLSPPTYEDLQRRLTKTPVFAIGDDIFWLRGENAEAYSFDKIAALSLPVTEDRSNLYAVQSAGIDLAGYKPAVVGWGFSGSQSATAFSRPLFDLRSGQLAGLFSPVLVTALEAQTPLYAGKETPTAILDASFNGSTIATLEMGIFGSVSVRFLSSDGDRIVKVCPDTERPLGDIFEPSFDVIELGAETGLKFGLLRHQTRANNARVAVRFGGGPLANPIDGLRSPISGMLAEKDVDQVIVSYPGSLGSGYSTATAFSDFHPNTLDNVATALNSWISEQRYEDIVVIGESFGALPAYVLAKALNSERVSVHLIVPLTQFSSSGLQLGIANERSLNAQAAFERAVFGSGDNLEAISRYYTSVFSGDCTDVSTFLYFAAEDNRIDEGSVPACLDEESQTRIYGGAGHDDIFYNQSFLQDLRKDFRLH